MDITSFAFYIFIAIFLALYWCMPKNVQWCFLLAGSAFFVLSGMAAYTCIYIIASVFSVWGATMLFQKVDSGNMGGVLAKEKDTGRNPMSEYWYPGSAEIYEFRDTYYQCVYKSN